MRNKRQRPTTLRQGDVLLISTDSIPAEAKPVPRDQGRVVLAYGEVTGHAHALMDREVELLATDALRYLRVDRLSQLQHEEHSALMVEPGTYEVRIQREYSPEAIRNVAD